MLIDTAQMEGYVSENDNGITVVLDTNLTEELLTEGFVREIISKVQTMRKEAGFEVMDQIAITYEGTEKAEKIFAEHADEIAGETLGISAVKADTVRICERMEDQRREGNTRRGKTVICAPP